MVRKDVNNTIKGISQIIIRIIFPRPRALRYLDADGCGDDDNNNVLGINMGSFVVFLSVIVSVLI